ncbi:hypothetical protein CCR75_007675 [Bremia lactucae]|uniref:Lysophospholipid acyltransferase n=1 Tax=Bremia lactucae TaxID=4779 RepID=A0A976NZU2_BRELC|nr:hypothetical protein CCR75_007675 [Bremia lactucae]
MAPNLVESAQSLLIDFIFRALGHLFNVVLGLFAGVFVFDAAVLHTIGTALTVYLLMMVAPRELVGRMVLFLLLAYLVGIHYYREFHSPDIVWDSAQMVLTLKLSSIAINYSDGGLSKEKKTPTMLKNELQEIPALIPYFGTPFSLQLVSAAGFLASLQFPVEQIDSSDFNPKSPWAVRCLLMCFRVVLFRFRYYLAWSLAEAASATAGVGYVQATGKWNGIRNNDIMCVEIPTNFRVAINNWNIGVARWINTCGIYIEVGKHLRRRLRSYFHYDEDRSAHPHDIFLSYFRGNSHPLAFLYDSMGVIFTWVAMQYAGIAFEILDVRRCIAIWGSWFYLPHVVCISLLLFFNLFPRRSAHGQKSKDPVKEM